MPFVGRTSREVICSSDQSADERVLLKTVSELGRVAQVARESRLEPNFSKVPCIARCRTVPLSFFRFVVIIRVMKCVGFIGDKKVPSTIFPVALSMHAWMKNAWFCMFSSEISWGDIVFSSSFIIWSIVDGGAGAGEVFLGIGMFLYSLNRFVSSAISSLSSSTQTESAVI